MPGLELQLSDGTVYGEKGRIETISGIIDPTTGSISVRAKFPNRDRLLLSGGSGNVIIPHEQRGCIVIPQSATFEVQDVTYAYKYESGVAKARIINVLEISNGKEYVVQNGLSAGDTIVVEGVGIIKDIRSVLDEKLNVPKRGKGTGSLTVRQGQDKRLRRP